MRKPFFILFAALYLALTATALPCLAAQEKADQSAPAQSASAGQADWRSEFNSVCSRSGQTMALSNDELKSLVKRCGGLEKRISQDADGSAKKVFLQRLKTCCGMYRFMLETRQAEGK
ncbi:MAG: hypothetical protein M0018_01870 [Nitrospiraceae bacterium]|nr:hypothetical protein [Nitrospiraceae bacterium]